MTCTFSLSQKKVKLVKPTKVRRSRFWRLFFALSLSPHPLESAGEAPPVQGNVYGIPPALPISAFPPITVYSHFRTSRPARLGPPTQRAQPSQHSLRPPRETFREVAPSGGAPNTPDRPTDYRGSQHAPRHRHRTGEEGEAAEEVVRASAEGEVEERGEEGEGGQGGEEEASLFLPAVSMTATVWFVSAA